MGVRAAGCDVRVSLSAAARITRPDAAAAAYCQARSDCSFPIAVEKPDEIERPVVSKSSGAPWRVAAMSPAVHATTQARNAGIRQAPSRRVAQTTTAPVPSAARPMSGLISTSTAAATPAATGYARRSHDSGALRSASSPRMTTIATSGSAPSPMSRCAEQAAAIGQATSAANATGSERRSARTSSVPSAKRTIAVYTKSSVNSDPVTNRGWCRKPSGP